MTNLRTNVAENKQHGSLIRDINTTLTVAHAVLTSNLIEAVRAELQSGRIDRQQLLTSKQVANLLNLSKRTVETLVAEGYLSSVKIRGSRRFTPQSIQQFIDSCESDKSAEV